VDLASGRVSGIWRAEGVDRFVDPLPALDVPDDDRGRLRTFPGRVDVGEVRWTEGRFEARLPRRFGDVGFLPGRGIAANGGWYPQPVDATGAPLVVDWDVTVRGPELLVVNGAVGRGEVRWTGRADRVALAAPRGATLTEIPVEGGVVRVVDRGREKVGHRELARLVPAGVTVVEDLDFRRLALPAPGMVYLTDRAFRLTPGFHPFHRGAVREAGVAASVPLAEGWSREFVAAVRVADLVVADPNQALGWLSWNPVVDELLYDGTLPWFGDVFDEPWRAPGDIVDALRPRVPARVVAASFANVGPGVATRAADRLLAGVEAAELGGDEIPGPVALAAVAGPVGIDLVAHVVPHPGQEGSVVHVESRPPAAPYELRVPARVDGVAQVLSTAEATDLVAPGRVSVDPDDLAADPERANNRWPDRWTAILTGGLYNFSATELTFEVVGNLAVRRQNDSRNLYLASAWHDEEDLAGISLGYVRYIGPNLDRLVRTHRVFASGGPALLDPAFRPTELGAVAVGGGVGYAWDTRQGDGALSGHRLGVSVGGGFIPGSTERWGSASTSAIGLAPLHPRAVVAARVKLGWASGDVEHRLLTLGGGDDLRSVAEVAVVGNQRAVGNLELRLAPVRHVSVPLFGLAWFTELQLAPGVEVGAVWRDGVRQSAVGANLGLHGVFDGFGARPTLFGVATALPLRTEGFTASGVQVFIDFEQAF